MLRIVVAQTAATQRECNIHTAPSYCSIIQSGTGIQVAVLTRGLGPTNNKKQPQQPSGPACNFRRSNLRNHDQAADCAPSGHHGPGPVRAARYQ